MEKELENSLFMIDRRGLEYNRATNTKLHQKRQSEKGFMVADNQETKEISLFLNNSHNALASSKRSNTGNEIQLRTSSIVSSGELKGRLKHQSVGLIHTMDAKDRPWSHRNLA